MRKFVSAVILALATAGCATMRGPVVDSGRTLTIHNEAFGIMDLSYRCTENGPVARLGNVRPGTSQTFVLKPASCSTVYLIAQPPGLQPIGLDRQGARPFAVVPLFGEERAAIALTSTGVIVRRDSATVARTDSEP